MADPISAAMAVLSVLKVIHAEWEQLEAEDNHARQVSAILQLVIPKFENWMRSKEKLEHGEVKLIEGLRIDVSAIERWLRAYTIGKDGKKQGFLARGLKATKNLVKKVVGKETSYDKLLVLLKSLQEKLERLLVGVALDIHAGVQELIKVTHEQQARMEEVHQRLSTVEDGRLVPPNIAQEIARLVGMKVDRVVYDLRVENRELWGQVDKKLDHIGAEVHVVKEGVQDLKMMMKMMIKEMREEMRTLKLKSHESAGLMIPQNPKAQEFWKQNFIDSHGKVPELVSCKRFAEALKHRFTFIQDDAGLELIVKGLDLDDDNNVDRSEYHLWAKDGVEDACLRTLQRSRCNKPMHKIGQPVPDTWRSGKDFHIAEDNVFSPGELVVVPRSSGTNTFGVVDHMHTTEGLVRVKVSESEGLMKTLYSKELGKIPTDRPRPPSWRQCPPGALATPPAAPLRGGAWEVASPTGCVPMRPSAPNDAENVLSRMPQGMRMQRQMQQVFVGQQPKSPPTCKIGQPVPDTWRSGKDFHIAEDNVFSPGELVVVPRSSGTNTFGVVDHMHTAEGLVRVKVSESEGLMKTLYSKELGKIPSDCGQSHVGQLAHGAGAARKCEGSAAARPSAFKGAALATPPAAPLRGGAWEVASPTGCVPMRPSAPNDAENALSRMPQGMRMQRQMQPVELPRCFQHPDARGASGAASPASDDPMRPHVLEHSKDWPVAGALKGESVTAASVLREWDNLDVGSEIVDDFKLPDIVNKKMANPNLTLTADESIDVLVSCINRGMQESRKAQNKELLMVIGNTGCGKSTLINYMEGCSMEKSKDQQGRTVIVVRDDSPVKQLTPIGHTMKSETFIPNLQQGSAFIYLDCPGFLDSRGPEINVSNAVNIKNTVFEAQAVRVVVLINYNSLKVDRGKGVRDAVKVLIDLFGDISCLQKHEKSIQLGISQTPKFDPMNGDRMSLEDFKKEFHPDRIDELKLASQAAEVLGCLGRNLFIYDPCDEGNESWSNRHQLKSLLKSMSPICDPREAFKTVLNSEDREQLQSIVKRIKERSLDYMKRDQFKAMRDCLNHIQSITQIGSPFVDNLLHEAEEELRYYLETLETEVWNKISDKDWSAAETTLKRMDRAAEELGPHRLSNTARDKHRQAKKLLEARTREDKEIEQLREQVNEAEMQKTELSWRSTDILMDQARNSKQVLDILNATVKSLQAELKADQEKMDRMEEKFKEQDRRREKELQLVNASYADEMQQIKQKMLIADAEQKDVLTEMMKKVLKSSEEKNKELERLGEEGKRNNEAELQHLRLQKEHKTAEMERQRKLAEMEPSTPCRKVALYKAKEPCSCILLEPCGTDVTVMETFPVLFPLVDEGDKCLLVHALWKAAGEPRNGACVWGASAGEDPGVAWSVENLEGLEFQALVDLQAVAGPGYRRSAPMALQLISLEQGNAFGDDIKFQPNKHLQPLHEYIKCDQELASSGGNMKNLQLNLNASAFATPSDYNSAMQYENLKSHLFDQAECCTGWLTLCSSPLSTVNLDDTARQMAGIAPSANFFSFTYPCEHSRKHRSNLAFPGGHWNDKDPFVQFLCNGGFVYFDNRYEICGMVAVTFDSSKEVHTHLHATSSSSVVFFAQHSVISEKVVEHLTQCGRWWPVTMDQVDKTYSHFAWICPCENVGGTIFTRWGGFAYLRQTAHQIGVYYPVYTNEKPKEYVGNTDSIAVAEALIKLRDSDKRRRDVMPFKAAATLRP